MTDVRGRCPACNWQSLFLGDGGHVTCSRLECPNPTAADELLHGEPGPATTQTTEPAWTPPPPGDTREQLPDHLLDLIRPYLRGYTSTACQTAGYLAEAMADHPQHAPELAEWRQRMRDRCRANMKYTGELCPHHRTTKEN